MFPTSGLFQEFVCPMFSAGSCDRPYCHFSHSTPDSAPSDTIIAKIPLDPSTPVYKPTPISLLEKRDTEHLIRPAVSHPKLSNGTEATRSVPLIPVYQPTPIRELDKYAPTAINVPGIDVGETDKPFLRPSEPPTYSPVVRPKPNRVDLPSTPSYPGPFVYQPSPAYPPLTDDCVHRPFTLSMSTITAPTSDSDDSEFLIPVSSNETGNKVDYIVDTELNSQEKKLKRKQPVCQPDCEMLMKNPDPPAPCNNRTSKDELEETESIAAIKRQKLLSLYKDLYGDHPVSSKATSDASASTKMKTVRPQQISITPYIGSLLPKTTQKELRNEAKDDDSRADRDSEPPTASVPRPRVPLYKSDKIPMPIRTRYLDQFIEECLVIYECPSDAYERALADEQACHDKATSRMAYLNAVIHCLKSLKSEKIKVQNDGVKKLGPSSLRKPVVPKNDKNSQKTEQLKTEQELIEEKLGEAVQGPLLYTQLLPYLLTEDQLIENGFPREDKSAASPLGKAKLSVPEDKRVLYESCKPNERICARCNARFSVDEFGNSLISQKCVYHWGRPVRQRTPGTGVDLRYVCCQADLGQPGCQLCPEGHVHESNKWFDTEGFVSTLPPLVPSRSEHAENEDESHSDATNVYAIDCEMIYTIAGCELGRVTVVDARLQVVLDAVVRPYLTVIDCNTRFSGLKQSDLERSSTRITDVQAKLLHLFDSDTILVGHSLESDLIALKLIHSKVVDTSVMFPHRCGPPKKRALRNLASELLQRIIQQDDTGHDSLEDAVSCMQLVQQKVKEDLRRGKWSLK